MEAKFWRVVGLPSVPHTAETRKIFEQQVNGSITEFATKAIVCHAESLGFVAQVDTKPEYISSQRFAEIMDRIARSRKADYTYLLAYEYLRSKHPGASSAFIQRQAVVNFN